MSNYTLTRPIHYYSLVQEPILIPLDTFNPPLVGDIDQQFTVQLGTLSGIGTLTIEGLRLQFIEPVSIPPNYCLTIEPIETKSPTTLCTSTRIEALTDDLALAIVDCNGCPTQYITLKQLKDYLGLAVPSICDQLPRETTELSVEIELLGINKLTCKPVRLAADSLACEKVQPSIPCPMMTR